MSVGNSNVRRGVASAGSSDPIDSIPGWLPDLDREMFDAILAAQEESGDLAELGVYQGKSAAVIGYHRRSGERFTVVDLFEDSVSTDAANRAENSHEYPGLTRERFEANYQRVHGELPVVITGPSQAIVDHARAGSHRFVHIDASHLYEHVVADIVAARKLLLPDGVVVLDDIRAPHTPGVAAAGWGAVAAGNLRPFALTSQKLYATWGDPGRWVSLALETAGTRPHEVQEVAGCSLVTLEQSTPDWRRWVPEAAQPAFRRLARRAKFMLNDSVLRGSGAP